jgi:hypothetical protein
MHPYRGLDVVAAMSIRRTLQDPSIEAHTVVGTHRALELLAQDVIQTIADDGTKADPSSIAGWANSALNTGR